MILNKCKKLVIDEMKCKDCHIEKQRRKKQKPISGSKPPKNLTIVNLFVQEKMAELKAAGAVCNENGNILKQATSLWKSMTDVEKNAYKEKHAKRLRFINEKRRESMSSTDRTANAKTVDVVMLPQAKRLLEIVKRSSLKINDQDILVSFIKQVNTKIQQEYGNIVTNHEFMSILLIELENKNVYFDEKLFTLFKTELSYQEPDEQQDDDCEEFV
jgi:HMG-box domain